MFFDVKKKFLPLLCVVLLPSAARSMGSGDWGGWTPEVDPFEFSTPKAVAPRADQPVENRSVEDAGCARLDPVNTQAAQESANHAGDVSPNVKGVEADVKALSGASASHESLELSSVSGLGNADASSVPAKEEAAAGSSVDADAEVNKKMLIQGLIFTTVAVVAAVGLYKAYTWLRANNKQKNKKMIENMKRKKRENKEPLVVRIPRPVAMWRSDR